MWVRLKKMGLYLNLCQFYIINRENGDIYIYIYPLHFSVRTLFPDKPT